MNIEYQTRSQEYKGCGIYRWNFPSTTVLMTCQKPLLTEFGIHLGKLCYVISICDQMVYLVCQLAWGGPVSESLLKCKQPSSLQGRLLISQPLPWMAAPQTFCLSLKMNKCKSHFDEAIKFEILKKKCDKKFHTFHIFCDFPLHSWPALKGFDIPTVQDYGIVAIT